MRNMSPTLIYREHGTKSRQERIPLSVDMTTDKFRYKNVLKEPLLF